MLGHKNRYLALALFALVLFAFYQSKPLITPLGSSFSAYNTAPSFLFPLPSHAPGGWYNVLKDPNARAMNALMECTRLGNCRPNQESFIIFESSDYKDVLRNFVSGENIWARSVMDALTDLGYSQVFARDMDHAADLYAMLGDNVKAVVATREAIDLCYNSESCLKSVSNPLGIRFERLFGPAFFGADIQPLGPKWTMVPENPESDKFYMGYSIEKRCMAKEIPSYEVRAQKRQVWVLAKWMHYFTDKNFPYSADIFERASKELDIEFIGAWRLENTDGLIPGVRHLGNGQILSPEKFDEALINSLAVVGVGGPWISPTPYYSVCFGIPFMNPYLHEGNNQHPWAQKLIGEEHGIYPVQKHDDEMFIEQLRKAISRPHDRYVPPHMTHQAQMDRVQDWLTKDYSAMARAIVQENPSVLKNKHVV